MQTRILAGGPPVRDLQRRQRILERLARVGPGPQAMFRDMCALLDAPEPMASTTTLVSHLLRELESSVRAVLLPSRDAREPQDPGFSEPPSAADTSAPCATMITPGSAEADPSNAEEHRRQISAVLESLGLPHDSEAGRTWLQLVGVQHKFAHRPGLDAPRTLDTKFLHHIDSFEAMLDTVLDTFRVRYLDMVDRLEALAAIEAPTTKDARRLRQNFPQDELTLEHFFNTIDNPAWLWPLNREKFFSTPPGLLVGEESQYRWFPAWPASRYLVRMATLRPADVLQIAERIPETDNPHVNLDLVEIGLAIQDKRKAVRLEPRLAAALTRSFMTGPDRYADLVLQFAESGQAAEALDLLRALLSIQHGERDNVAARVGDYEYVEILRRHRATLTRLLGLPLLSAFADLLQQALTVLDSSGGLKHLDRSDLWYPALERDPEERDDDVRAVLTAALRDTGSELIAGHDTDPADVLAVLERYPLNVVLRVKLRLLELHGDALPQAVERELTRRADFREREAEHEWQRLAHARASALDPAARSQAIRNIVAGPDLTTWRSHNAADVNEEWVEARIGYWRRDRLGTLHDFLTESELADYDTLCARYGPPRPLDPPPAYRTLPTPASPVSASDLASKTTAQLVAYVTGWAPTPAQIFGDDQLAFLTELRSAITIGASAYSAHALLFRDLRPACLATVLGGLQDAVLRNTELDWNAVCDLCAVTVETSVDPDVHSAVAQLLRNGLAHSGEDLPVTLAETIWRTITTAFAAARDTADDEQIERWDRAHGQLLHAAVNWSGWRHEQRADVGRLPALLDRILKNRLRESGGVPVALGERFAHLHHLVPDWAHKNARLLTGTGPFDRTAWRAYLASNAFRPDAAQLLFDAYQRSILEIEATGRPQAEDLSERLGLHLLRLFFGKVIAIDSADGLITDFYARAPSKTREQLAWMLAEDAASPAMTDNFAERLVCWWEWRLAQITENLTPAGRDELLAVSGCLIANQRFPRAWAIQQLAQVLALTGDLARDPAIFASLATVAEENPEEVFQLLAAWSDALTRQARIYRRRETDLASLLRSGLRSGNASIARAAREIINRAAAQGHGQFRPLMRERDMPGP